MPSLILLLTSGEEVVFHTGTREECEADLNLIGNSSGYGWLATRVDGRPVRMISLQHIELAEVREEYEPQDDWYEALMGRVESLERRLADAEGRVQGRELNE